MKAYGCPRVLERQWPDKGDIAEFGMASGKLPGKGGDIRSSHKNAAAKAATRRYFKRLARKEGKKAAQYE